MGTQPGTARRAPPTETAYSGCDVRPPAGPPPACCCLLETGAHPRTARPYRALTPAGDTSSAGRGACREERVRLPGGLPAKRGKLPQETHVRNELQLPHISSELSFPVTSPNDLYLARAQGGGLPVGHRLLFPRVYDAPKGGPRWPGPARQKRSAGRGVPWQALGYRMGQTLPSLCKPDG